MRWKIQLGLIAAVALYILFGALMFMYVENDYKEDTTNLISLSNMTRLLKDRYPGLSDEDYYSVIREVVSVYKRGELKVDDDLGPGSWDFSSAVFFVITALTTIGYGNIAPVSPTGRGLCVAYCLIGIPLLFYTLAGMGESINAYNRRFKYHLQTCPKVAQLVGVLRLTITFVAGWIFFIQMPALILTAVEGWTYSNSIYFAFVTLSTIGFGDLYPNPYAQYSSLTRFALIVWLFLGLAWLSATITAMQDVLNHLLFEGREHESPGKFRSDPLVGPHRSSTRRSLNKSSSITKSPTNKSLRKAVLEDLGSGLMRSASTRSKGRNSPVLPHIHKSASCRSFSNGSPRNQRVQFS